jgi:hypothetical protein
MNNATVKELLAGNKWRLLKSDDAQGFAEDVLTRYMDVDKQESMDAAVIFLKMWTDPANYTDDTSAAAPTVTTPMVHNGKTRSGIWYGGRVTYDWVTVDDLPKLRLFQVLYKGNVTVSGVETENNCSYDVDTTYYFKAPTLVTLPAADVALAINYERDGVTRDSETGTYNYWISKRTRLYQKVAEYTSRIDSEEKVLSTHHRGVKAGDKNDAGTDIGLKSMTAAVVGEAREQHRQKNADCSQDIDETTWQGVRQAWSKTWQTFRGTAFYKRVSNATEVEQTEDTDLSGLDATTNNSVSGGLNRLGLRDYTITKTPPGGDRVAAYENPITSYFERRRYRRIYDKVTAEYVDEMRKWVFIEQSRHFATFAGAANWWKTEEGADPQLEPESKITESGGQWKATRIFLFSDTGWVDDVP